MKMEATRRQNGAFTATAAEIELLASTLTKNVLPSWINFCVHQSLFGIKNFLYKFFK